MDEVKKYNLVYTKSAMSDILEKVDYIAQELHSPDAAMRWYQNLRTELSRNLSSFPKKFPCYKNEPWHSAGIRWMTEAQRNARVRKSVFWNRRNIHKNQSCDV